MRSLVVRDDWAAAGLRELRQLRPQTTRYWIGRGPGAPPTCRAESPVPMNPTLSPTRRLAPLNLLERPSFGARTLCTRGPLPHRSVRRCWRRGRRGRDRRRGDRQLEFQQRRVRHHERRTGGRAGPCAPIRPGPAELASRDGHDHHGSGSRQGQGRGARRRVLGDRQPSSEAERRLVRRPYVRNWPAPRLRQQGLQVTGAR
jgi:hypothetical protein